MLNRAECVPTRDLALPRMSIALEAIWWWPFLVTLLIRGYGYLFVLGSYGVAEEGTPDDADAGHQTRSPVSS